MAFYSEEAVQVFRYARQLQQFFYFGRMLTNLTFDLSSLLCLCRLRAAEEMYQRLSTYILRGLPNVDVNNAELIKAEREWDASMRAAAAAQRPDLREFN